MNNELIQAFGNRSATLAETLWGMPSAAGEPEAEDDE